MRSVLITGGTGSFGQAFVGRLLRDELAQRICVFSRGEHRQAQMRERFQHDDRLRWFIGDVRDRERLRRALDGIDLVVHAAALKRIEVGHYNPIEMVKTNVIGAINVIEASMDAGVSRVVALSTDKAYAPVSAYGQSKALAESIFLSANHTSGAQGPVFAVTRYGNVSGSEGSIIPKWRALIESGAKTVPVTDPDCTRFWMTMEQAVELVWHAANLAPEYISKTKPIVPVLPAYRVGDLAEAMGVAMDVSGLPEWEKKHESMCDAQSSDQALRMSVDEIREALAYV